MGKRASATFARFPTLNRYIVLLRAHTDKEKYLPTHFLIAFYHRSAPVVRFCYLSSNESALLSPPPPKRGFFISLKTILKCSIGLIFNRDLNAKRSRGQHRINLE